MSRKITLGCLLLLSLLIVTAQQQRIDLDPTMRPFYHGVESGDPMEDKVIIWTRVTPDTGTAGDIEVYWQVATDTGFTNVVNYGKALAVESEHYCVKVDVCGLQPANYYYYMFNALGHNSIVGRTKTAPAAGADVDSLRFAVVSCASWEHGYFNTYESIVRKNDVDAVVHLGDYIYEYGTGGYSANLPDRQYEPATECINEIGYELRYSQYKLDKQLQRVHQLFPFIAVWDDHETANNAWKDGAGNHTPATEGPYVDRKRSSTSTYFKWMPLRKPDPADTFRIFRTLRYGKLLDLVMLDTRLYDRDEQDLGARNDANRYIMGPAERAWFFQQLTDTTTRWKIIGNQVMFAPLEALGVPVNSDQWDGYAWERGLIQNYILNNNVKDVVILTGDIHTSWCNDVPGSNYNSGTGANSVCVEFVGTSITSPGFPLPVGASAIKALNSHVKYLDLTSHGYFVLNVMKNRTQADYTFLNTITSMTFNDSPAASYFVNDNERFLRSGSAIANVPKISAPIPSLLPNDSVKVLKVEDHFVTIPENTSAHVSIIPGVQVCPMLAMAIIDSANYGSTTSANGMDVNYTPVNNYYGYDTVAFSVCNNDSVPVCDTVYLYLTINSSQDIDTILVNLHRDSSYTACLAFNDLVFTGDTVQNSTVAHSQITYADTCFSYVPDSAYAGIEWVAFTTCDSAGYCDTIVYQFKVDQPVTPSSQDVTLTKNTQRVECLLFDDLVCKPGTITVTLAPKHATYQLQGDSCLKFSPHFNYTGDDSMRFVGCDTCGLQHCDTITVYFHTVEPSVIDETKAPVVFGMYPNPVEDKLIIQYYLFEAGNMDFNIYEVSGKLISSDNYYHSNTGLQYAQLSTSLLPPGNYIVELKTKSGTYRKKIVKE